jgi:hypothetical protein
MNERVSSLRNDAFWDTLIERIKTVPDFSTSGISMMRRALIMTAIHHFPRIT